jgi:hypothetical protein
MAGFRPETSGSGRFGQIPTVLARSDKSRPDSGRFGQIRQYSGRNLVAIIGRRQDTGNRMLSDSGAGWIPTINNC